MMLEEEIKVKLILPYLEDLGFSIDDLSLEQSFKVRFGTTINKIPDTFNKTGRLDILCKHQGSNLFVIEVKREDRLIKQADIDQGVSYARLLDQIAPFVIVSNGHTTRIIDTISKQDLSGLKISSQSDFWSNGCVLATEDELRYRFSALKHFVNFSESNLRIFCHSQVESRINSMIGSKNDLTAKFVHELHVSRNMIIDEFGKFLETDKKVFAIVGESGTGKSVAICDLCISSSISTLFPLFYNGPIIAKSLLELICLDLNLFFSAESKEGQILGKLELLVSNAESPIVLFVDAIDEVTIRNFNKEISDLARALESTKNIRLCISCKSAVWNRFLEVNTVRTHLYESVYMPEVSKMIGSIPGVFLQAFGQKEMDQAITKYQEAFSIQGEISASQRKLLRNPLLLRLACIVFASKSIPANARYNEVFEKYLKYVAAKAESDVDTMILPVLTGLANALLRKEEENDNHDCYITKHELCHEIGIQTLEDIPDLFFAHSLLISGIRDGRTIVQFNQTLLRDYIICYHCLNLPGKPSKELEQLFLKLSLGQIGLGALYYYSCNASPEHSEIMINNARLRALQYVKTYDELLDFRYRNMKRHFEPYTDGPIGIVITESDNTYTGPYALVPIKDLEISERIIVLSQEEASASESAWDKYGVTTIHFSMNDFLVGSIEDAVEKHINVQLKEILNKGLLLEDCSELLLKEKISSIIFFYWKELGNPQPLEYRTIPRMDQIYPIDLHAIRGKMLREFGKVHFMNQQVRELIASGEIKISGNSYSYSGNDIDQAKLSKDIEDAILQGSSIPEPQIGGNYPPWVELKRAVCKMIELGHNVLEAHYLPTSDIPVDDYTNPISFNDNHADWMDLCIMNQFSKECIKSYISDFFKMADVAYKELVDYCLPHDKHRLDYYNTLPHRFIVILPDGDPRSSWRLSYGYCQSSNSEAEVQILHENLSAKETWERLEQLGSNKGYLQSLSAIMYDSSPVGSGFFLDTSIRRIDSTRAFRNFIYRLLLKELKMMF